MGTPVTIHGGQGSDTINFAFTVTGTNTTFYTQQFQIAVNDILATGSLTQLTASNYAAMSLQVGDQAQAFPVYLLDAPDTTMGTGIPDFSITTSGFVLDTISGAANITLSGADTVLVAAINAEADITGAGNDNRIVFVTGQNVFDGTNDTGGDTVVAGSGQDTIYTSMAGSSTVFSGTGEAKIVLQDTTFASTSGTSAGGINDLVYLQDGINTVLASGAWDAVIATQENQTIYGYTSSTGSVSAGSILVAVLQPNSDGTASGNDLVNGAGTDSVYVFDNSSGNTIDGGAGNLNFLGAASVSAALAIGTGNAFIFGSAGDSLTITSETATGGNGILVAGSGAETLDGSAASNTLYITGGDSTAADSIIGGTGTNYLTAGGGNETLQGGTGTNNFVISDAASANANLTLSDFSTSGSLSTLYLTGFSQGDVQTILNSTNDEGGNLVVTIGNSTTVTFTGITAGSQLTGHIVTF